MYSHYMGRLKHWGAFSMSRNDYIRGYMDRTRRMVEAFVTMPPASQKALLDWEAKNLDGETVRTSDWPGWAAFVDMGITPIPSPRRVYYHKPKASIPVDLRWEVWERDNLTCLQCGRRRHLRVDHIIPESKGGEMIAENLQTLCHLCNSIKGVRIGSFQRRLK